MDTISPCLRHVYPLLSHRYKFLTCVILTVNQEVPKAADRAPSRTYYLWYAEPERCYQKILTCLYRTLGNIHEQRMYEKEGYARLIERRAIARLRSTMHLMTPEEKEQLRIFDQSMERLDVAALRIVNLVMILTNYR